MSESLQLHGLQPARLLFPWEFSGNYPQRVNGTEKRGQGETPNPRADKKRPWSSVPDPPNPTHETTEPPDLGRGQVSPQCPARPAAQATMEAEDPMEAGNALWGPESTNGAAGAWAATLRRAANKRSGRGSESIRETLTASDRRAPPIGSTGHKAARPSAGRTQGGPAFSREDVRALGLRWGWATCGGGTWIRLSDVQEEASGALGTPDKPGPGWDKS